MGTNPVSSDYRIFGIDIGVKNMGMASIVITGQGRTVIERLDWRPLIGKRGTASIGTIVDATGAYLDAIMRPDLESPFVSTSNTVTKVVTPVLAPDPRVDPRALVASAVPLALAASAVPGAHAASAANAVGPKVGREAMSALTVLVPHLVLIEQQYVTEGVGGSNVHALEIQVALMTRFAERCPGTIVRSVGAASRRSGGVENQKARADMIGRLFTALDSPYWNTYLISLVDTQHTSDAITMVLDHINYRNLPVIEDQMHKWESTILPTLKRKTPRPRDATPRDATPDSAEHAAATECAVTDFEGFVEVAPHVECAKSCAPSRAPRTGTRGGSTPRARGGRGKHAP